MANRFRVRINLELVRANLSKEDQQPVTPEEVRKLLLDAGFVPDGDAWIVDEPNLGHLDPSEVIDIESVE